jgi:hypothetical protein
MRAIAISMLLLCTAATLWAQAPPRAALPFPEAAKLATFEAQVRQQMEVDKTTGLSLAFQLGDSVWATRSKPTSRISPASRGR